MAVIWLSNRLSMVFQRVANEMAPKWKLFSPERQTKKKKYYRFNLC